MLGWEMLGAKPHCLGSDRIAMTAGVCYQTSNLDFLTNRSELRQKRLTLVLDASS